MNGITKVLSSTIAVVSATALIGYFICQNEDLREEAEKQISSVLRTTKKIVSGYSRFGDMLSSNSRQDSVTGESIKVVWDRTLEESINHTEE